MKWFNRIIVKIVPLFPQSFTWLFSRRYVAGTTLESGVQKTHELTSRGVCATMDVLGEDILDLLEATAATEESLRVLEVQKTENLDANLSIKLSSLGLRIDMEACFQNARRIVAKAKELGNFVRIDMEDSSTTDDTLAIYRRLLKEFDNCGVVIQAYLRRSETDVKQLIDEGIANLRVCKGIYIEPEAIAFQKKDEIRGSFARLIRMMLASESYIGIATHDRPVIDNALALIQELKADNRKFEFQMLLGVTESIRDELVRKGFRMRVYVPFGEQWHAYSMRRLKENPQVAGHIVKNLFIRG